MIECPTCGNITFQIRDELTVDKEHIIECTGCLAAWTMGFEDEEVRSDIETKAAGEDDRAEEPELGSKARLVRH